MNTVTVSVIIPTYNRANYLPEALDSVLRQTWSPFEIIIIDDGSTDNTAELLQRCYPLARYVWQENQGVAMARNKGLREARGDIIAWLDADDIWEADFLSTLVRLLIENPELDGVYSGFTHINAAGDFLPTPVQRVVPPVELYSALLEADFVFTSSLIVYRRCYLQTGNFDPQFRVCEDYDMFLRLARTNKIAGLLTPLVRRRIHPQSTMMEDVGRLCQALLTLAQKHFGSDVEGEKQDWTEEQRRGHAHTYAQCAYCYIQAGAPDTGWRYIEHAADVWPPILTKPEVLYELACGDQARGQRGRADLLDINRNGLDLLEGLNRLFAHMGSAVKRYRASTYGNAYLALAMLSDQAGHWSEARRYLWQAIRANPRLLAQRNIIRRLVKLVSGKRAAQIARSLRHVPA